MPSDHRLRLDDDQALEATWPQTVEPNPKGAVKGCQPRPQAPLSLEDRHLVTKRQVPELELQTAPNQDTYDRGQKTYDIVHAPTLP